MNFPETKSEGVVTEMFGNTIPDPYHWLEDTRASGVQEWTNMQNAYVDQRLRGDEFELFSKELTENFKSLAFSVPVKKGRKYFFYERQPDEDHQVFCVKNGIDSETVRLIDPNGMNAANTVSLDYCQTSRCGEYVAYGLSEQGTEMATMYVKNVETNENLSDRIERCRYSKIAWLPDSSGFFYTRNQPLGSVPSGEEHLHTKVYFHELGTNSDLDELVFGEGRPKDDMITINLSMDGRYLAISVGQTWAANDVYMYDTTSRTTKPLIVGINAEFSPAFLENQFVVRTNYRANNYRALSVLISNLFLPVDEWQELVPEREYVLKSLSYTKDKIIAEYLVNVCSKVVILDHRGVEQEEFPLPQFSSIEGISANREEKEFFYGVTSFLFPKIIYRYLSDENIFVEYRKIDNPIDPEEYIVTQEWFQSKDSTRVPAFIFHKKNIGKSGCAPTILHGYGGFKSSLTPSFMKTFVPWLEHGGVVAVANIRGGGEFGDDWHKEGTKEKKQNSYDDFIAAAEYLISAGYTDKRHLGILGGSNGGLLVSAVSVERPDLFKAVCSRVPLTDMVRFHLFGIAMRWVHEYGDPRTEDGLRSILKWSPYHNAHEGIEYPATFFTTGLMDSRVDPLHARKMAALLQSINKKNDVLILTEMDAGHGSGKPISKMVETQALILAFFSKELQLKII